MRRAETRLATRPDIVPLPRPAPANLVASHFPERCRPSRFFWYGVAVSNPARFGKALAARRRALGLNLSGLAMACNRARRWFDEPSGDAHAVVSVTYETLFRLERSGTCTVSEATAVQVMHALGLTPEMLDCAEPAGRDLPRCLVAETRWCLRQEDLDRLAGWPVKFISEEVVRATLRTRSATEAARATGVSRRTIYYWIARLEAAAKEAGVAPAEEG